MILARVIGNVVGTQHHPTYDGRKVMLVRPIAPAAKTGLGPSSDASNSNTPKKQIAEHSQAVGTAFIAVDHVQAGPGDCVLVLKEGSGVRQVLGDDAGPIRSLIVAIVDEINLG